MDIKEKIKGLPDSPGVYMMKDKDGVILYVGKARSVRKRVQSYFQRSSILGPRLLAMVSKVEDVDFIQTPTEAEALIFEAHLAKVHKPKYNVELKDDKAYPLLKLTTDEPFPRLLITRRRKPDGALYFGPYTSSKLLRQALAVMRKVFPLRTCKRFPKNVCLMFHLGQCLGPCEKRIDEKKYNEIVRELLLFLEGKRDELIRELSKKMAGASENKEFEEAAKLRDRMKALTVVVAKPKRIKLADQLASLQEALDLPSAPLRIDAFDISNIFGSWAVGSMVQFTDGTPNKANYRRFKIESVEGIDDYKMTKEVIQRRYFRCLKEKLPLPDLIIVDGGKGHINIALDELKSLGLGFIPTIALAKELEKIYVPDKDEPVILPPTSSALHFVQRIRNEAHRFAVSYHRGLRAKEVRVSELDEIPGIGERRKAELLKHFGTIEEIKKATLEELLGVPLMNKRAAEALVKYFRQSPSPLSLPAGRQALPKGERVRVRGKKVLKILQHD